MTDNQALATLQLPAHGPQARDFVLHAVFGEDLSQAWVANVRDTGDDPAGWNGGHIGNGVALLDDDQHAHYFSGATIDGPSRASAYAKDGVALLIDDIGEAVDKAKFKMLAPEPTLLVETSLGCFQAQYVIEPKVPVHELERLLTELKRGAWRDGVKKGSGAVQYMRLPSGINAKRDKPNKFGFKTRLISVGSKYTFDQLMREFGVHELKARSAGAGLNGSSKLNGIDQPERCTVEEARDLLRIIGKHKMFDDRGKFVDMCHALIGALGRTPECREIYVEWCSQWVQGKPGEPERVWDTQTQPVHLGGRKLREWAKEIDSQGVAGVAFDVVDMPGTRIVPNRPVRDVLIRNAPGSGTAPQSGYLHELPMTVLAGIDRGEITVFGGQTGAFKSLYSVLLAVAITEERGDLVASPDPADWTGDVIIASNEDSKSAVEMRIDACLKANSVTRKLTNDIVVWDTPVFIRDRRTKEISINPEFRTRLTTYLTKRDVAMIVADTLTGTVIGGSEESNYEFQTMVMSAWRMAILENFAVVLVHHLRKGSTAEDDDAIAWEMLRGGGVLGNTPRNGSTLGRPSTAEKDEFSFSDDDVKTLTKVKMRKRSHGMVLDAIWFRRVIVDVGGEDRRRKGVAKMTGTAALVLERPQPRKSITDPKVWRSALDKIAAAEAAGIKIRVYGKGGTGKVDSAETVLGTTRNSAKELIDTLRRHQAIEVETIPHRDGDRIYVKVKCDSSSPF